MKNLRSVFLFATIILLFTNSRSQNPVSVSIEERNIAAAFYNLALKDIQQQQAIPALGKLMQSLKHDSTLREAYVQLYQVCQLNHDIDEKALELLRRGKRIFQEDDELCFYCGEIYRRQANEEQAIKEYSFAIEYAKANGDSFYLVPYYYQNRGNIYLKQEKLEEALSDYNALLKLKPGKVSILTNRGTTYFKLGQKENACQDWNAAMELGCSYAKEYYERNCQQN